MTKRTCISRIILVLIALIIIASIIAYFMIQGDKPWTAFYIVCCGGVLVVNLILILIFVRKNLHR